MYVTHCTRESTGGAVGADGCGPSTLFQLLYIF